MFGFFNPENPFFTAIGKIVDIIILSVIWSLMAALAVFSGYLIINTEEIILLFFVIFIITMIPVGPATTALYYATVKSIRKDRGYPFKEFFRSFKANFKQGAIISVIFGAVICLLYFDFTYITTLSTDTSSTFYSILFAGLVLITIILLFISMYIFAVLSRFTLPLKNIFKNSLIMSIRHMPSSLLMTLIFLVFAFITWFLTASYLPIFFITPGLCCLVNSFLIERIMKKYMAPADPSAEAEGVDQWYLE